LQDVPMKAGQSLTRALAPGLIALMVAACSTTDGRADTQVRPSDRPECQVGSQREDLSAGVPTLMGGTGCRADPDHPRPLNRPRSDPNR